MTKTICSVVLCFFLFADSAAAQDRTFIKKLDSIVGFRKAVVGFSVQIMETGDTISLNGDRRFPMQSVYKFHLALAVLDRVDNGKLKLDQKVLLKKMDLHPDTHSPLRDKYPDGNVYVTIDELLRYTVGQSDNNGCDILFGLIGGTSIVDRYIKHLGILEVAIVGTEAQMHADYKMQFNNYSTPKSATALLLKFAQGKVLHKSSTDYLMKVMQVSTSGPKKLKGLLPPGTLLAHKTGYSGTDGNGLTYATNDIGLVVLPNGNHMLISAFVTMSSESEVVNDRIIAELAKASFEKYGAS
ncbi:MAG: class A beta-lactamase, subclass A2 [Pedobacter sp.]